MVYWTEENFKEIYGRYQESGLSIREFCNRDGILEDRFHHWKKKLDLKEWEHVLPKNPIGWAIHYTYNIVNYPLRQTPRKC